LIIVKPLLPTRPSIAHLIPIPVCNVARILVVYYSRTGFTRTVARQVAALCHADMESIKDLTWRHHGIGYLRSAIDALFHLRTTTRRTKHEPKDYDMVVIGTPIWCWNVATPVRTYIEAHRGDLKLVAFFCTCGGSGQRKVLQDLEDLTGLPPIATLSMTDDEIRTRRHQQRLQEFVAELQLNAWSGDAKPPADPASGNAASA